MSVDSLLSNRLLNKNFMLLIQGQVISLTGHSIYMIGLVFWLKQETDSPMLIGIFSMFAFLPAAVLGPFGGVIADRYSRKKIIVLGDLFNGCLMLAMASVMFVMADETSLIISLLFMVGMASGVVNAFFGPAVSASILDLVPRYKIQEASGLLQITAQVSVLVGRTLGGILFVKLGALALMVVNGVGFLISAVSESFISLRKPIPTQPNPTQRLLVKLLLI